PLLVVVALHVVDRIVEPPGQLDLGRNIERRAHGLQLPEALVEMLQRMIASMRLVVARDEIAVERGIEPRRAEPVPRPQPLLDPRRVCVRRVRGVWPVLPAMPVWLVRRTGAAPPTRLTRPRRAAPARPMGTARLAAAQWARQAERRVAAETGVAG